MLQEVRCGACGRRFEIGSARFLLDPSRTCLECGGRLVAYPHGLLPASAVDAEPVSKRIRVFIGDDDPTALFTLSERILEQTELQIVGAAGEITAVLAIIRATQPQVVLLAHLMPGFEPAQGVARIRAEAPRAKVLIALSRSIAPAEEMRGADGYVRKAESTAKLSRTVHRVCQQPVAAVPTLAQRKQR